MLNQRPSNIHARILSHLDDAWAYVHDMPINVNLPDTQSAHARRTAERVRRQYFRTLTAIAEQHQPFYTFSRNGRTDRLFGYGQSVLALPKEVRQLLYQGFWEIDLRSAHLLIAAWLWDAGDALAWLVDPENSVWDELMKHYRPLFEKMGHEVPEKGSALYKTVKAGLKIGVYSTVYGMPAPSIQANVTKSLANVLGPEAGAHMRKHWLIKNLLAKRDERLSAWDRQVAQHGRFAIKGPTGITIEIETTMEANRGRTRKLVDAKSAMASLAQSYEQSMMGVILEYERDRNKAGRNHFHVALWIHDGAYVTFRGKGLARLKELRARLEERCKELADFAGKDRPAPAFFEVEPVVAPNLPACGVGASAQTPEETGLTLVSTMTPTRGASTPHRLCGGAQAA
jgi:hypothetical protein